MATLCLVLAFVALMDVLMLLSGYRVLVGERRFVETVVEDRPWQEGVHNSQIECSYWTGRSVQKETIAAHLLDECAALVRR